MRFSIRRRRRPRTERNLEARRIHLPLRQHPKPQRPASPSTLDPAGSKLDINSASEAEIENIQGIGPVLAQRIIAARPFKSADDLRRVKGIGDSRYEKIRPHFQ